MKHSMILHAPPPLPSSPPAAAPPALSPAAPPAPSPATFEPPEAAPPAEAAPLAPPALAPPLVAPARPALAPPLPPSLEALEQPKHSEMPANPRETLPLAERHAGFMARAYHALDFTQQRGSRCLRPLADGDTVILSVCCVFRRCLALR
jgi:hypothetical protein